MNCDLSLFYKQPLHTLKGVGIKTAELFEKLGIENYYDLLHFYPREYEEWKNTSPIAETVIGEVQVVKAKVLEKPKEQRISGGRKLYKTSVTDGVTDMSLTFFNNKYIQYILKEGHTYYFRGKVSGNLIRREMMSPEIKNEKEIRPVFPIYHLTQGLTNRRLIEAVKSLLSMFPENEDSLPLPILEEYGLIGLKEALVKIHFPKSETDVDIARKRLAFEEFLMLQMGLMKLKEGKKAENLNRIKGEFPEEFLSYLNFELTGAQKRAIKEAVSDMSSDGSMNRLLQGDVGSGKTAVAAALCYTVIKNGMQAALMAPTEILASQHFESLSDILKNTDIKIELLTGSVKMSEKKRIYEELSSGRTGLLVGTHAIISEKVTFNKLGLVITDEQHRFGVNQRFAFAAKGRSPHRLVMSATPIPRTLALMIYGDLDISVLNELPPGRQKIETYLIGPEKRLRAYEYVNKHIAQGRQCYMICSMIDENDNELENVLEYTQNIQRRFPGLTIRPLHGKMKPAEKESIMQEFSKNEIDILVSTVVIEVGVDVPNAVIMLIENAERYGLSQLHQLRGRVGRGKHKSTCILITPSKDVDTLDRLKAFASTSDGFKISEMDLKMRGPGDFFGNRQHGLPAMKIADLTSDMDLLYQAQNCAGRIINGEFKEEDVADIVMSTKRLFSRSDEYKEVSIVL